MTVTLSGVSNATTTTDASGQYAFTGLRMGNYSVAISGFDSDEIGFSATASAVAIGVGESKVVSFDGTYLRTAGIQGQVSVEGEGLAGVTVSLTGGPDATDMTTTTDASGQYSFAKLRAGDYAVGISGYDTKDYEFEVTSQNVTVALGETATVPFEGTLLRTSGVSGRVSVEGTSLADIAVTLSGGDLDADMAATTDAGGLYAFAGLAAGDYTVSIAVEGDAYVFETTSMDVTVGDDETQVVNFDGAHATTASISGTVYVDEGTNNNMMDEGETPFAAAGVPVTLVGPGVHDITPAFTNEAGQFMFPALRAGAYQLVVQIPDAAAALMPDFAYGGPTEGYSVTLGVGEEATQNIPMDITHQTVNFAATLRSGEDAGAAIPDATVTLYRDMDGEFKITDGTTGDDGMAAIRFERRRGDDGNAVTTVYASVATDDYDVADGMETVEFNAQAPMSAAANAGDILNLTADVSFAGATITTDAGGGDALKGWAISVMSGDEAVEGAPAALDDDGMASFMRTIEADDLPVTYTFALSEDQDNKLDGGETVETDDPIEYTHDGLSLKGTMDLGTFEARYTTQTLKVYVHHERDQVHGYTGNVLGGDERMSGKIDVNIRFINDAGRSRPFPASDSIKKSDSKGVVTFTNVPADHNVIAVADEVADLNVMLIDPDELSAYTDDDGATGGMFGDDGGYSHTVSLCPLKATSPQDHGACGSFAFVSTHAVSGQVWKRGVKKSGDDFTTQAAVYVAGKTVSLDPVDGKNLAGDPESQTTTEKNDKATPRDDTHEFDFGRIAAGVYKLGVPTGWRAMMGADGSEAVGNAFNPLAGDVTLDVTPSTATVYGRVNGEDGFYLDSVTVTANGVSTDTDKYGRYILEGIAPETRKVAGTTHKNSIFVQASRAGFDDSDVQIVAFAANTVTMQEVNLDGTAASATVSGTVTAFGSDTPIAGVEIQVDGKAPMNKNAKSSSAATKNDIHVTGADGTYTIKVPATSAGEISKISARKDGYTFSPASVDLSTLDGSSVSGIDFEAIANSTISGRVKAPAGGPFKDVMVKAIASGATEATDSATTGATGTYSLSVPAGTYTLTFSKAGYAFTAPEGGWTIRVSLGQSVSFAQVEATEDPDDPNLPSLSALSLSDGTLSPAFSSAKTKYTAYVGNAVATITVTATASHDNAGVAITPADADANADGHQVALNKGANEITVEVTAVDNTTTMRYHVTVTRDAGSGQPSAPRNLKVTTGAGSATLNWEVPIFTGTTAITGYEWQVSTADKLPQTGTTNANTLTVDVSNLTGGVTYTFSVWAVNSVGRSPAETKTLTLPAAAITLQLFDARGGSADDDLNEAPASATARPDSVLAVVSLDNALDEDITVTVKEIVATDAMAQLTITGATITIPAGKTAGADTAIVTAINDKVDEDTGVNNATHTAMVQAISDDAHESSVSINITDDDEVPDQPRNLAVTPGDKKLILTWSNPAASTTANVTEHPIVRYEYRHSTSTLVSGDAWTIVTGGVSARTVTISDLTNDTPVNVEVRAVSAAGDGAAVSGSGTPTS